MRHVDKVLLGYNVAMVAAGGAILLVIALATLSFSQTIERQSLDVDRAGVATRAAANLLVAMLDAETGQRGYLLTHDARYLSPFARRGRQACKPATTCKASSRSCLRRARKLFSGSSAIWSIRNSRSSTRRSPALNPATSPARWPS